jgi:hypothetical protein
MSELKRRFQAKFFRARSMKQLTHFLDTPKRSEIPLFSSPYPSAEPPVTRGGSNTFGRSFPTAFRLLRFLFIVRKSILAPR